MKNKSKTYYIQSWFLSLMLFLAFALAMTLVHCFKVEHLICIELAPTARDFYNMAEPFSRHACNELYYNTLIDFGYMAAYTLMFYYSGQICCDLFKWKRRGWLLLLCLPILFDATENILMLQMIPANVEDYCCFGIFYWAVRIKWVLVIPGVIMSLIALAIQIYSSLKP